VRGGCQDAFLGSSISYLSIIGSRGAERPPAHAIVSRKRMVINNNEANSGAVSQPRDNLNCQFSIAAQYLPITLSPITNNNDKKLSPEHYRLVYQSVPSSHCVKHTMPIA
jgi:hypothetical protein